MSRLNISLSDEVKRRADELIAQGGYDGLSDLLKTLVRDEHRKVFGVDGAATKKPCSESADRITAARAAAEAAAMADAADESETADALDDEVHTIVLNVERDVVAARLAEHGDVLAAGRADAGHDRADHDGALGGPVERRARLPLRQQPPTGGAGATCLRRSPTRPRPRRPPGRCPTR